MNMRPRCPDCGTGLICPDCDDTRPKAREIWAGWRIRSPFGRWETVTRTEQSAGGVYTNIWTSESGRDNPWVYSSSDHLDAERPRHELHGEPEIRVLEGGFRDAGIYIVACIDTDMRGYASSVATLASAMTMGRGKGWQVQYRKAGEFVGEPCSSKSEARRFMHRLAKDYAKSYGVKLNLAYPNT